MTGLVLMSKERKADGSNTNASKEKLSEMPSDSVTGYKFTTWWLVVVVLGLVVSCF